MKGLADEVVEKTPGSAQQARPLWRCKPEPSEISLTDEQAERRRKLIALLERHGGNVSAGARELSKDRVQIHRWLKLYDIDLVRYRG
jgi:transcriptional regulator with GAF, ATPase, and Fis domain